VEKPVPLVTLSTVSKVREKMRRADEVYVFGGTVGLGSVAAVGGEVMEVEGEEEGEGKRW